LIEKVFQSCFRRFTFIAFLAIIFDQLSKTAVIRFLSPGEYVQVVGNFFKITLILNPGGVFGTRLGSQDFYTFISILAIGATLWFFFKVKTEGKTFRTGLSLVLGGAIGNLMDRFRFGKVVDFLDFDFFDINLPPVEIAFVKFPGFYLDRWPVFNLADSFVLVGMVFIILHLFFSKEKQEDGISPISQ
jgi:signal peptidase II